MKLNRQQKPTYVMGIDPGNIETAFMVLDIRTEIPTIVLFDKISNERMSAAIQHFSSMEKPFIAMEGIANYGGVVGRSVFDTCIWIGRFMEIIESSKTQYDTIKRKTVMSILTGQAKGGDSIIRAELIDLYGAPGKKKSPGPTYGITSDVWSALGIATAYAGDKKWISI